MSSSQGCGLELRNDYEASAYTGGIFLIAAKNAFQMQSVILLLSISVISNEEDTVAT
jgi:hypothetical protein